MRGAAVRRGTTGTDLFTAMIGLVARNKRRYGGYIVHVGIVLMFLGFAGEGFGRDEQALLKPGEQVQVDRLRPAARRASAPPRTARSRWSPPTSPCSTPAAASSARCIRPSGTTGTRPRRADHRGGDLAVAGRGSVHRHGRIRARRADRQRRNSHQRAGQLDLDRLRLAGARHRHRAAARAASFAFATARVGVRGHARRCCCSALLLAPVSVLAQTTGTLVERSQLERDLANEVMCTCGCRLPAGTCGMMNCAGKASQLAKVKQLVSEGQSRDQVLATSWRSSADSTSWRGRSTRAITGCCGSCRTRPPRSPRSASAWWRAAGRARSGRPADAAPALAGAGADSGCSSSLTMSSATSTDPGLRPWQLFLLARHAGRHCRGDRRPPASRCRASSCSASPSSRRASSRSARTRRWAARRAGPRRTEAAPAEGHARQALEREKALVLRSIKEIEFDHAMRKTATADFEEMRDRLRRPRRGADPAARRQRLPRRQMERDLARRTAAGATGRGQPDGARPAASDRCATCQTANDADARFCKQCGASLARPA